MTWRRLTATLWILAALMAGDGARPQRADALQAVLRPGPDADTLTVSAEGGQLPRYTVRRTGPKELTVTFTPAPGEKAPAPPPAGGSRLVAGVRAVPGGFKLLMRSPAFGYVNFPVSGRPQMQVQIFQDDVGARWADPKKVEPRPEKKALETKAEAKPSEAKPSVEPKPDLKAEAAAKRKEEAERRKAEVEQKKAEAAAKKLEEAERRKAEVEQKKAEAEQKKAEALRIKQEQAEAKRQKELAARQPKGPDPAPPPASAPQSPPQAAPQAAPAPAAAASPSVKPEGAQPYFSTPNTYRAPVSRAVLGTPGSVPSGGSGTTLPEIAAQGSTQSPAPASAQAAPARPAAEIRQLGGKVPAGVVEKPLLQENGTGRPPGLAPGLAPAPGQPTPAGPVSASLPLDVQPAQGKSDVRFRAERHGPDDPKPTELVSGVPARGASPGQPAQMGQPPQTGQAGQTGRNWELRQPVQKILPAAGGNASLPQLADPLAAPEPGPPQPEIHTPAGPTPGPGSGTGNASADKAHPAPPGPGNASDMAQGNASDMASGNASAPEGKKQAGSVTEQQLKDKILSAQSNMVGGNWAAATTALEEVLRDPGLKGDLREETLYSLADALMQQHRDNLSPNYDKITGAQLAAMNANQKSVRVPRALFNLGLLNLKVGNMAEAKAYFNIINKKYPQDQNAALIPYYLGEHYRAKGELQKAAEQYQTLIQKHPDSRPVKEAAYTLAQILRRLGQFDKGFQIVDYIDKRWPLFYMENPAFLKLAAEIEEKVGKLPLAKDHYWTYYNLEPDAEFADITLVRIGDIYLRQNKRAAAREVYQKAVHDFPDREGGQVARMRLAEEGIYDDPTMSEMGGVFSRPDSLKPNETYELLMTKYPASPLAPLAQLKLGMWQFHNKSYLEALNTASSFLEKHPKSPLAGKAGELGFNAFLMALPAMVQEGHFQKIMQLFDGASFVKENQDKIGDEARMAIAIAAWKRGDPDRALKLAGKFLGKQQVPKYSEMALDMAMNIFLERKEWGRISELAQRSSTAWKLSPRQKTQFEYARAMALENMGDAEKSMPLWTKIASDTGADPATRAYATYLLAKAAARKQDMHRLFALAQDALGQLLATGGDRDKIKDCLLMTITATERSGRYAETVKWAREFDRIIPESDPDWAPVRLRLADIYQKGGMQKEYRELLQGIVQKKPNTVYSRMAQQALDGSALDQRLQNYLMQSRGGG